MATSPAFNPPSVQPKDTDPMVIKVPMKETEWANRSSQQPSMRAERMALKHVPNGN